MKKILFKILLFAVLICICVTSFSSCQAKGKTLAEVKKAGKLTIATSPDFPPFESLQSDGTVVGIEIDIMNEICKKLGVNLEVKQMSFDSVLPAITSGKYDVGVSGITVTESRKKNSLFTNPYCLAAQAIVVLSGSNIQTKADLAGKKVSVQTGTTAESYCMENGYSVLSYESNSDAENAVVTAKVDAWVIDDLTAADMVKTYNAENTDKQLVILSEAMTTEPYAFAFTFGSTDLVEEVNMILKEMNDSGKIAEIFEKYEAPFTAPTSD